MKLETRDYIKLVDAADEKNIVEFQFYDKSGYMETEDEPFPEPHDFFKRTQSAIPQKRTSSSVLKYRSELAREIRAYRNCGFVEV
ncbi:MAG: hypothetical protein ACYCUW_01680 [bacterium]